MTEAPRPETPAPATGPRRPRGRLPLLLVLAAMAGALGSKLIFKEKPAPTPSPAQEQAVIDSLSVSLEKVAEREFPSSTALDEVTWTLLTSGQTTKLMIWLDQAMPRVGGKFLFTPSVGEGLPSAFTLELPADSRLRLCLALEAWGKLSAPDFDDPTPAAAAIEKIPDLPADLETPGAAPSDALERVKLVIETTAP